MTAHAHLQGSGGPASRAVLVLHGGREHGTMPTRLSQLSYLRMLDLYAGLRARSRGTAVYLLRYRVRGWNPGRSVPDPVADARWALDQIAERHPGAPIALLGHSMGGRAAFAVSDHPSVVGICGLAPWLPQAEPLPVVDALRSYVIAHGTADRMTSPSLSRSYARRLRAAGGRVARFELPAGAHAMLDSPALWHRFAVSTTLGLAGQQPMPPAIAAALAGHDPRTGLETPLADALAGAA